MITYIQPRWGEKRKFIKIAFRFDSVDWFDESDPTDDLNLIQVNPNLAFGSSHEKFDVDGLGVSQILSSAACLGFQAQFEKEDQGV